MLILVKGLDTRVTSLEGKNVGWNVINGKWGNFSTKQTSENYSNRKISSYWLAFPFILIENKVNTCGTFPSERFEVSKILRCQFTYNSTSYYVDITNVNDTSIKIKSNFSNNMTVYLYGFVLV